MTILYDTKINQRAVGFESLVLGETHIVGIMGIGIVYSGKIKLTEVPLKESPSSISIPGYVETTTSSPSATEFFVDYTLGYITFNTTQDGNTVNVTYKGRGSEVDAVDVNEVQIPLGIIANYDGTLTNGIVTPLAISTNPSDDFTFPNDLTVNGEHINLVAENLAVDPVSPVEGQIWYNTVTKQYMGFNGTSNVVIG